MDLEKRWWGAVRREGCHRNDWVQGISDCLIESRTASKR